MQSATNPGGCKFKFSSLERNVALFCSLDLWIRLHNSDKWMGARSRKDL